MKYVLAERYVLEALIGRGPAGAVWRAHDQRIRETLAIKLLSPHLSANPYTVERFQRERHTLTAFLHPTLVRVRDIVVADRVVALITELVTGSNLRDHLESNGPMAPAAAVETAAAVAEALAAVHDAGVVHCGLKPTNVLLDKTGQVRVTDCRIARLVQEPKESVPGSEYLAPELARGGPPLPATDVYALGVLLMEMLTGDPRSKPGPAAASTPVPEALWSLVNACLRTEPTERPTPRLVAATLRGVLGALNPGSAGGRPAADPHAGRPVDVDWPGHADWPGHRRPAEVRWRNPRLVRAVVMAAGPTIAVVAIVALAAVGAGNRSGNRAPGGNRPTNADTAATSTPSASVTRSSQHGLGPPPTAEPASAEGATAFVRYWFDALNHAVSTGNTAELEAASTRDCQVCTVATQALRNGYQNGASLRGGTYAVREVLADGFWNPDQPKLQIVFDRGPRSLVRADGSLAEVLPGVTFVRCQVVLDRLGDRWLVREVLSSVQLV